jgi:hypothetical protein
VDVDESCKQSSLLNKNVNCTKKCQCIALFLTYNKGALATMTLIQKFWSVIGYGTPMQTMIIKILLISANFFCKLKNKTFMVKRIYFKTADDTTMPF